MAKTRIAVLGGGMIGSAVALDLCADGGYDVTVADVGADRLARVAARTGARTVERDLSRPEAVADLVAGFDLAIGALPSAIGYQTVRAAIEAGRNMVDISFMADDALALDAAARGRGVTIVVDCGIAPGVSNMMTGFAAAQLATCERVEIFVGGLPVERRWPFEYKAGFAPCDVIEEYVRPSLVVESGRVVTKPALSEPELIDFPGIGTLEAFITDGLRSLVRTVRAESMTEKTLRYPGHIDLVRALRETGFFSKEPIAIAGARVRPLDVTAALMFPKWTFDEGEADLTVMRVAVEGTVGAERTRYRWDVLDRYDPASGLRSMSRTTGFSAAIVARLVASGRFTRPGVCAPEAIGAERGLLEWVLGEIESRGIRVQRAVERAATGERS